MFFFSILTEYLLCCNLNHFHYPCAALAFALALAPLDFLVYKEPLYSSGNFSQYKRLLLVSAISTISPTYFSKYCSTNSHSMFCLLKNRISGISTILFPRCPLQFQVLPFNTSLLKILLLSYHEIHLAAFQKSPAKFGENS